MSQTTRNVPQGRGRPKRSPVEALRVRFWFYTVAWRLGISPTGYAFEKFFSPENLRPGKRRSCQWDRYKRGKSTPSPATIALVEARCPGSRKWLELPLWTFLDDTRLNATSVRNALDNLRPSIASRLYFKRADGNGARRRRPLSAAKVLEPIARESDIDALACLIGLFVEAKINGKPGLAWEVEYFVRDVFLRVMCGSPYRFIAEELLEYLLTRTLVIDHPRILPNPWFFEVHELDQFLTLRQHLILKMEDLELIGFTEKEHLELLYWYDKGDRQAIGDELAKAYNAQEWELHSAESGLGWLVAKLRGRNALPMTM